TVVLKFLHDLRDRRALLPDRTVNTNQVVAFVVDDGVESDGSLAGLAVADDQLALSAADRNHRVDGLDPRGHWLARRLARDNARRETFDGNVLAGGDRALVVNRLAQRVHYAADEAFTRGHGHDLARAFHFVALFDLGVLAHEHRANLVFFQVH